MGLPPRARLGTGRGAGADAAAVAHHTALHSLNRESEGHIRPIGQGKSVLGIRSPREVIIGAELHARR